MMHIKANILYLRIYVSITVVIRLLRPEFKSPAKIEISFLPSRGVINGNGKWNELNTSHQGGQIVPTHWLCLTLSFTVIRPLPGLSHL